MASRLASVRAAAGRPSSGPGWFASGPASSRLPAGGIEVFGGAPGVGRRRGDLGQALLGEDLHRPIDRDAGDPGLAIDPSIASMRPLLRLHLAARSTAGISGAAGCGNWSTSIACRPGWSASACCSSCCEAAHHQAEHDLDDDDRADQDAREDDEVRGPGSSCSRGRSAAGRRGHPGGSRLPRSSPSGVLERPRSDVGSLSGISGQAFNCQMKTATQTPPIPTIATRLSGSSAQGTARTGRVGSRPGRSARPGRASASPGPGRPPATAAATAACSRGTAARRTAGRNGRGSGPARPTASRRASAQVPGDLLRQVAAPDDQVLGERHVGPEHGEGQHQVAQVVQPVRASTASVHRPAVGQRAPRQRPSSPGSPGLADDHQAP